MGVKVRQWKGAWWIFVNFKGRRRAKRCASQKAAELARDKIDAALTLGQTGVLEDPRPAPAVPTLKEYAERWLETGTVRLRPQTLEQYRAILRLRILPTLGPLALTAISRDTVRTLVSQMAAGRTRQAPERPVSRATVKLALRVLCSVLSTAEEDGLIAANPARRMGRYLAQTGAEEVEEIEIFERAEVARLLETAARDFPEYFPFLLCLARTGMRLGEALALEWRDMDFAARVILVRRSRRRNRVSEPKNGKARRVDMSAQLAEVLGNLKTLQEAEAALSGAVAPDRVFSTPEGNPIQETTFREHVWGPLLRRAELRYRKLHTLRHTFASLLLDAGEPLIYVQQQLGHHSPAFTLTVYGHLLPRGDRRAVDTLDDATIRNPRATDRGAVESAANLSN